MVHINESIGTSLVVQWLRFLAASVGGWGGAWVPSLVMELRCHKL